MTDVEQRQGEPLAQLKLRLGSELNDVVFFGLLHLLALPFAAKAFAGFDKAGVDQLCHLYVDFVSMLLDEQRSCELEKMLLAANRAHASINIPPSQVLASLAAFAVSTYDWLDGNTTIKMTSRETLAFLDALSNVGKIMNVGETPKSMKEYRKLFEFYSGVNYCPIAKRLMKQGAMTYWKLRGARRLLLVLVLFTSSLSKKSRVVFGLPRLPTAVCRAVQRAVRVRWIVHDLLSVRGLPK